MTPTEPNLKAEPPAVEALRRRRAELAAHDQPLHAIDREIEALIAKPPASPVREAVEAAWIAYRGERWGDLHKHLPRSADIFKAGWLAALRSTPSPTREDVARVIREHVYQAFEGSISEAADEIISLFGRVG